MKIIQSSPVFFSSILDNRAIRIFTNFLWWLIWTHVLQFLTQIDQILRNILFKLFRNKKKLSIYFMSHWITNKFLFFPSTNDTSPLLLKNVYNALHSSNIFLLFLRLISVVFNSYFIFLHCERVFSEVIFLKLKYLFHHQHPTYFCLTK